MGWVWAVFTVSWVRFYFQRLSFFSIFSIDWAGLAFYYDPPNSFLIHVCLLDGSDNVFFNNCVVRFSAKMIAKNVRFVCIGWGWLSFNAPLRRPLLGVPPLPTVAQGRKWKPDYNIYIFLWSIFSLFIIVLLQ